MTLSRSTPPGPPPALSFAARTPRNARILVLAEQSLTRFCPETGEEVDVEGVTVFGTWCPGEPGSHYDPPIPPGVEEVWAEVHGGRALALYPRETDHFAERMQGT